MFILEGHIYCWHFAVRTSRNYAKAKYFAEFIRPLFFDSPCLHIHTRYSRAHASFDYGTARCPHGRHAGAKRHYMMMQTALRRYTIITLSSTFCARPLFYHAHVMPFTFRFTVLLYSPALKTSYFLIYERRENGHYLLHISLLARFHASDYRYFQLEPVTPFALLHTSRFFRLHA